MTNSMSASTQGPGDGSDGGAIDWRAGTDGWQFVEAIDLLDPWLSRVNALGYGVDADDVMSVIVASGEADSVLRIVEADTAAIHTGPDHEALRQFVPHTRVFFHRPKAVELGWDAVTAGGVFVTTGSGSLASGLTILRRTIQTFKTLTVEEMDVVLVMRGVCGTRDRHRTTVTAADLAGVYQDSPIAPSLEALIASLLKKGVVTEADGGWRLVP